MKNQTRRVILGSGHRVDQPGRKPPRFPQEKEAAVRAAMARQLGEWGVGAGVADRLELPIELIKP